MPDTAFAATERQFRRLLDTPGGPRVDLRLFSFPSRPDGGVTRAEIGRAYAPSGAIALAGLDALIVTGCEPRDARLDAEPWFAEFAEVVDWAADRTVSTLFSCLAAHAAVLHLDGIVRRPLREKCWGVFTCERFGRHPLLKGSPTRVEVPHSRWNDVAERDLTAAGYQVLRRSSAAGVDLFVREDGSLFVFLQGHPEYDGDTLGREHRRDLARFIDGARATCPPLPERYFSDEAVRELAASATAPGERPPFGRLPLHDGAFPLASAWQREARRLMQNWLAVVAMRKANQQQRIIAA